MSADEEIVKAIAKQLPVKAAYTDAIKPAAKQLGHLGEDILKALRLALFPVTVAAGLHDRFERFVKHAVARIPEKKRVSPAPQIVGPVLEGVRYEPEGTTIDQMFSQLLSASMDSDRLKDAHPSFPMIIKQLSSDEAKILNSMFASGEQPKLIQIFQLRGGLAITSTERNDLPVTGLDFPENLSMYTDRLERLGLIRFHAEKPMEPIVSSDGHQVGGRNFLIRKFTEVGEAFMRACSPERTGP
jgi:Abortive infection alpha